MVGGGGESQDKPFYLPIPITESNEPLYSAERKRFLWADSWKACCVQSAKDPQHTACPFSLIATVLASNSINKIAQLSALIGAYLLGEIPSSVWMLVFGVFVLKQAITHTSLHLHLTVFLDSLSSLPHALLWISLCASWSAKGTEVPPEPLTGYFHLLTECLALSLTLLPHLPHNSFRCFMWKKWIIPLMPQCVPLMYAQLLIREKRSPVEICSQHQMTSRQWKDDRQLLQLWKVAVSIRL